MYNPHSRQQPRWLPRQTKENMSLSERLSQVHQRIASACARSGRSPDSLRILAVTKTASPEQLHEACALGLHDLAENRVQVLEAHARELTATPHVRWHMIGHLQRNKVKQLLPLIATIQSVDSLRLAEEIEKCAAALNRRIPVLLEVNAGEEAQKFGAPLSQAIDLANQMAHLPHLDLQGLMSMAPLTDDLSRVRAAFARTRDLLDQIRAAGHVTSSFRDLSMGMSGDFETAIEHGATILRLGTILFG